MKLTSAAVVRILGENPKGLTSKEILKTMGQSKSKKPQLRSILKSLASSRAVAKEHGRYVQTGKAPRGNRKEFKATGVKSPRRSQSTSHGFFIVKDGKPFYLAVGGNELIPLPQGPELDGAISGDELIYHLEQKANKIYFPGSGRKTKRLQGEIFSKEGQLMVRPSNQFYPATPLAGKVDKELSGFQALVDSMGVPNKTRVDQLVPHNISLIDFYSDVLGEFHLQKSFPPIVEEEAAAFGTEVQTTEGRTDLTHLDFVTIDGDDAKDYDDAVYIEENSKGFLLYVSIADVAHYVTPNSKLNEEALKRSTSVYLPGMCLPMLPESLSNGLCSLQAGKKRLAMTCEMQMDGRGNPTETKVYESLINVKQRLTYAQVDDFFETGEAHGIDPQLLEKIKLYALVAEILRVKRTKRGSINFHLPDVHFSFGKHNKLTSIEQTFQTKAQKLIEQLMLEANESVGLFMDNNSLNGLWRNHAAPLAEKVQSLKALLNNEGIVMKKLTSGKDFNELLEKIKDKDNKEFINMKMLRSMSMAVYEDKRLIHFGLAANHYLHFTSPIRRYPDLVVHRAIKEHIKGNKAHRLEPYLGEHCSDLERNAQKAERLGGKLQALWYMAPRLGDLFSARINGMNGAGVYASITSPYVEGFVPWSSLLDDHYRYDQDLDLAIGRKTKRKIQAGDPLTLILTDLDFTRRSLEFTWVSWETVQ